MFTHPFPINDSFPGFNILPKISILSVVWNIKKTTLDEGGANRNNEQ